METAQFAHPHPGQQFQVLRCPGLLRVGGILCAISGNILLLRHAPKLCVFTNQCVPVAGGGDLAIF